MSVRRPQLSPEAARLLDEFEGPAVLGASRQVGIASRLLLALIDEHAGDTDDLLASIRAVVAYLSALRGDSSQAIPNALRLMTSGLDAHAGEDVAHARAALAEQIRRQDEAMGGQLRRMVECGASLVAGCSRVLVYDYSSSVAQILTEASRRGIGPAVLIAEARPLEGGKRYVEHLAGTGLRLEFIPDAALGSRLKGCDLALFGAETLSAQGDCFNTTGSLLVALAAHHWRVSVYAVSTLIKIDVRTLDGHRRPNPDLGPAHLRRLAREMGVGERASIGCPDLDLVPADLLTGIVTELGVLPPGAIAGQALRLAGRA